MDPVGQIAIEKVLNIFCHDYQVSIRTIFCANQTA